MGRVRASWARVRQTSAREHAERFVLGGVVAAVAGWIGHRFGPIAGGLFLAFPSILPASLTLVEEHEGRAEAAAEARGAVAGSAGLAVFALVVWLAAERWGLAPALALATAAWLAVSSVLWRAFLA
jgi:uncharacterized membrane protein (GlpM family)